MGRQEVVTVPALASDLASLAPSGHLAVICDSAAGMSVAALAALYGREVIAISPSNEVAAQCVAYKRPTDTTVLSGALKFALVSNNVASSIRAASAIVVCGHACEYEARVHQLAPYLTNSHTVVLIDAPLGAALQFSHQLASVRPGLQTHVLECGTIFDTAVWIEGTVSVRGLRDRVSVCGTTRNHTRLGLAAISGISSGLVPASNCLERGFGDMERYLRPALQIFTRIGARKEGLNELLNPDLMSVLQGFGNEVQQIAKCFGQKLPSCEQLLRDYSGASGSNLREAIISLGDDLINTHSAQHSLAVSVQESLPLLASFGNLAHLATPVIDSLVRLSSCLCSADLSRQGRNLGDLGLLGYDVEEIIDLVDS